MRIFTNTVTHEDSSSNVRPSLTRISTNSHVVFCRIIIILAQKISNQQRSVEMTRSHPESYAAPCIGSLHSRQKRQNISVSGSCTITTSGLSLFISTPSKYKTQVVSQHMNPPHDLYVSIACRILRFEIFSRTCRQ